LALAAQKLASEVWPQPSKPEPQEWASIRDRTTHEFRQRELAETGRFIDRSHYSI
jgi:hypothetical protein